jgi:hypothetical protein
MICQENCTYIVLPYECIIHCNENHLKHIDNSPKGPPTVLLHERNKHLTRRFLDFFGHSCCMTRKKQTSPEYTHTRKSMY